MEALLEKEGDVENWNDDRLDELSGRMDEGFKQINSTMKEGFEKIDKRFEKIDQRFEKIDQRFQQVDQRFEKMVTREEMKELIASVNARSDRLEDRVDRLYYGCVALVVLLVGNAVAAAWF
jgi:archaellum component FlaC